MTGRGAVHPSLLAPAPVASGGAASSVPAPLAWTWNPWREHPWRATCAAAGTVVAGVLAFAAAGRPVFAVALALAVGGALAPLLVPQRCRLDDEGLHVRGAFGWERRAWRDVRRVVPRAGGVLVSPYAGARRLDTYRALFVPLPVAADAAFERALRVHLERHGF